MAVDPITWQNVSGPAIADPARLMEAAQRSGNAMFGGLTDILKQRDATEEANRAQMKINNTNAFMNTLYGAQNVDQMTALQKSGQLQQMLETNGAQIDQAAARAAMDTRPATLQQRGLNDIQYKDALANDRDEPVRNQIGVLIAQGKTGEAQALLNAHTELRKSADLAEANRARIRGAITEGQADQTFGFTAEEAARKEKMFPLDQKLKEAQASNLLAEAGLKRSQTDEANGKKAASNLVAQAAQWYQGARQNSVAVAQATAKSLGIPLDAEGKPDFSKSSAADIASYSKAVAANGGAPISDTDMVHKVQQAAIKAGLKPDIALHALDLTGKYLQASNSLAPGDAAKLETKIKTLTAKEADAAKNNMFYVPDSGAEKKAQTDLLNKINTEIKDSDGTKMTIRKNLSTWMTEGIDLPNGKKFVVPAALMQAAVASGLEQDAFPGTENNTDNNAKKYIIQQLSNPANKPLIEEANYLHAKGPSVDLANFKSELLKNSGVLTPDRLSNHLELSLNAARRREAEAAAKASLDNPTGVTPTASTILPPSSLKEAAATPQFLGTTAQKKTVK